MGKTEYERDLDGKRKTFPEEKAKVMENENKMFNQKYTEDPSRSWLFQLRQAWIEIYGGKNRGREIKKEIN